jgi:hypothetical protein
MCDVVDVIGNTPTHVPCKKRAWKVTSATVWGVGVSPLLSKDILPFNKPHKTNVFHMYQHSKGLSNGERIFYCTLLRGYVAKQKMLQLYLF